MLQASAAASCSASSFLSESLVLASEPNQPAHVDWLGPRRSSLHGWHDVVRQQSRPVLEKLLGEGHLPALQLLASGLQSPRTALTSMCSSRSSSTEAPVRQMLLKVWKTF